MTQHFYTTDHPESNGRIPQPGEHAYSFMFPLAHGESLVVHCGDETMLKFSEFIGSMMIDNEAERIA
jgi:hypothetical protein